MTTALTPEQIKQRLRYMGQQYRAVAFARGGEPDKHYLEQAADCIEALEAELAACRVRSALFNLAQRKGLLIIRTENVGISQNDPTTKVSWMEGHPKACDISNDAAMAAQEKA